MAKDKFSENLTWADLQAMGDPDKSDINIDQKIEPQEMAGKTYDDKVRVYIEKKGRSGKTVTLVKGLSLAAPQLDGLCKELKGKCGVGGKREGRDIMIQGDQRVKVIKAMIDKGYKDVKNAGA